MIWYVLIQSPVGISNNEGIATGFSLGQNYPNPFNPVTTLEFQIAKSESVQINVYDILGRKLETLINEKLNQGTYELKWDASDYSSGVYYYRLTVGNFSDTKKMILIK
jgi:flagellar hook assembly protein FlgD